MTRWPRGLKSWTSTATPQGECCSCRPIRGTSSSVTVSTGDVLISVQAAASCSYCTVPALPPQTTDDRAQGLQAQGRGLGRETEASGRHLDGRGRDARGVGGPGAVADTVQPAGQLAWHARSAPVRATRGTVGRGFVRLDRPAHTVSIARGCCGLDALTLPMVRPVFVLVRRARWKSSC